MNFVLAFFLASASPDANGAEISVRSESAPAARAPALIAGLDHQALAGALETHLSMLGGIVPASALIKELASPPRADMAPAEALARDAVLRVALNPGADRVVLRHIQRAGGEGRDAVARAVHAVGMNPSLKSRLIAARGELAVQLGRHVNLASGPDAVTRLYRSYFDGAGDAATEGPAIRPYEPPTECLVANLRSLEVGQLVETPRGLGRVHRVSSADEAAQVAVDFSEPDSTQASALAIYIEGMPLYAVDASRQAQRRRYFMDWLRALRDDVYSHADFLRIQEFRRLTDCGFFSALNTAVSALTQQQKELYERCRRNAVERLEHRGISMEGLNYYERMFMDFALKRPVGNLIRNRASAFDFDEFVRAAFDAATGRINTSLVEGYIAHLRDKLAAKEHTLVKAVLLNDPAVTAIADTHVDEIIESLESLAQRLGLVERMDDARFKAYQTARRQAEAAETAPPSALDKAEHAQRLAITAALLAVRALCSEGYIPISSLVLKRFPALYAIFMSQSPAWTYRRIGEEAGLPAAIMDTLLGIGRIHIAVPLRQAYVDWLDTLSGYETLTSLYKSEPKRLIAIIAAFGGLNRALAARGKPFVPLLLNDLPERHRRYADEVPAGRVDELATPAAPFPEAHGMSLPRGDRRRR